MESTAPASSVKKTIYGILTLANKITILRLLLVPILIFLLFSYAQSGKLAGYNATLRCGAAGLFLLIFLMDIADGLIARLGKQVTALGTVLDPVADKVLVVSSLIALVNMPGPAFEQHLPNWYVLVTISRDIYLLVGALVIYSINYGLDVKPHVTGKCATFFNVAVVESVLLNFPPLPYLTFTSLALACTVGSAIQYTYDGVMQFRKKQRS